MAAENYFRHDCVMKYMAAIEAEMEELFKILRICEILPVYFVDRLIYQLQLPSANNAYLVGFSGLWKINCCMRKTDPRNLEKFAAENCGRYK